MQNLSSLYTIEGLLHDKNADGLAEGFKGKIYVPYDLNAEIAAVTLELAARMAYECVALDDPILAMYDSAHSLNFSAGDVVISASAGASSVRLDERGSVFIKVNSTSAYQLRRLLCGLFPALTADWQFSYLQQQLGSTSRIVAIEVMDGPELKIKIYSEGPVRIAPLLSTPMAVQNVFYNGDLLSINNLGKREMTNDFAIQKTDQKLDLSNLLGLNTLKDGEVCFATPLELRYRIPKEVSFTLLAALTNCAARLSLESTSWHWPLIEDEANNLPVVCAVLTEQKESRIALDGANKVIHLSGHEQGLLHLGKSLLLDYPSLSDGSDLNDISEFINATLAGKTAAGQLLQAASTMQAEDQVFLNIGPEDAKLQKWQEQVKAEYQVDLHARREPFLKQEWEIAPEWEVDTVRELLATEVFPKLKASDELAIKIIISEPLQVRKELETEIAESLKKMGIMTAKIRVYRAYKQAISWIMEDIVPQLLKPEYAQAVRQIRIGFRPFLAPGISDWGDEAGGTPTLNPDRGDDPSKYFELATRLLQELYPVDDLVANVLPIKREQIEFYALAEGTNHDYAIECYDLDNHLILKDSWNNSFSERPYLSQWPQIGKVHPNTGLLEVTVNDRIILKRRIKTDLEQLWDFYQDQILPDVAEHALNHCDGVLSAERQPFFRELRLEIVASEPEHKLSTRQDLISTLDAFHEDLYFVGLDFFRTLGLRHGVHIGEPGLILPVIRVEQGASPRLKATLYTEIHERAGIESSGLYHEFSTSLDQNSQLIEINYLRSSQQLEYQLQGEAQTIENRMQTWLRLAAKGVNLFPDHLLGRVSTIDFKYEVDAFRTDRYHFPLECQNSADPTNIATISVPQTEVISYEMNNKLMAEMAEIPELALVHIGETYQGRKIEALEVKPDFRADVISRAKLINTRVGFMLNHRHHANEVSATNSAFRMIQTLLTNPEYAHYRQKLNIMVVPLENADGAAVHYQLMQDNPEWKLHVARYNSVGQEIANHYFNEDTPFSECLALPHFYKRWLPDAFVDNHGVPSHEWDQQFAGYVAPWFKGFWLPRALFYGYFWHVTDETYSSHRQITEEVARIVARDINQDADISAANMDWQDRYRKYAHDWLPKLFPAEYRDHLIFYWANFVASKEARHFGPRFPEITVLDWTTEVSDETAQGGYLEQCSRALTISDFATMEVLAKLPIEYEDQLIIGADAIYRSHKRVRPVQLG